MIWLVLSIEIWCKLGLDDADFGKGVANSKKQVQYLAKEMQQI